MTGATLYLTKKEMALILEALDMLETDFTREDGSLPEGMSETQEAIERKLFKAMSK